LLRLVAVEKAERDEIGGAESGLGGDGAAVGVGRGADGPDGREKSSSFWRRATWVDVVELRINAVFGRWAHRVLPACTLTIK
jgi:hypothetical protein